MYQVNLYPTIKPRKGTFQTNHVLIFFFVFITAVNTVSAEDFSRSSLWHAPEKIKKLLKEREIYPEDVPNPHWRDGACVACHTSNKNVSKATLRSTNIDQLCSNCHNELSLPDFTHPSGPIIPSKMWQRIPSKFKHSLRRSVGHNDKTVSCRTCHDMPMQCLKSRRHENPDNPNFLRLGPYRQRTDLCFNCHNPGFFQRLSPHEQIVAGKLDKATCRICHKNTRQLTSTTKLEDADFPRDIDFSKLCTNCHPWTPHPGWEFSISKKKAPNHLVKPKPAMRERMKRMQQKLGIILPIGQASGKIHCATCHNPHQKGVIKSNLLNAGADSRKRVRMKKTCSYCHDI